MTFNLSDEAEAFGVELQTLLDAVLPYQAGVDPALRQVTVSAAGTAFAVELGTLVADEAQSIPLLDSQRQKVANLFVQVRLVADSADRYPAVSQSLYELRVGRLPILRLDFNRDMHTAPGSHWNVHAERGAVTALLTRNNPRHSGELSKVHIPVGGARMRPCLEDLLQLLAVDFKFQTMPQWRAAVEDGRVRWRKRQLAAMVRDDPEEAVRVLRDELNYDVAPPAAGPRESRLDRLKRW